MNNQNRISRGGFRVVQRIFGIAMVVGLCIFVPYLMISLLFLLFIEVPKPVPQVPVYVQEAGIDEDKGLATYTVSGIAVHRSAEGQTPISWTTSDGKPLFPIRQDIDAFPAHIYISYINRIDGITYILVEAPGYKGRGMAYHGFRFFAYDGKTLNQCWELEFWPLAHPPIDGIFYRPCQVVVVNHERVDVYGANFKIEKDGTNIWFWKLIKQQYFR
ncbi:MAG TPA: hypothetical protein VGA49_01120 [Patescibacteria group bacterium]